MNQNQTSLEKKHPLRKCFSGSPLDQKELEFASAEGASGEKLGDFVSLNDKNTPYRGLAGVRNQNQVPFGKERPLRSREAIFLVVPTDRKNSSSRALESRAEKF